MCPHGRPVPAFRSFWAGCPGLVAEEKVAVPAVRTPPWDDVFAALAAAGAQRWQAMSSRGWALPGARAAIAALAQEPGIVQSLLTGNIRPNAMMKVTALNLGAGLDFAVGAYGSDSEDRAELVAIAQQRASRAYQRTFARPNTVLIGDTDRDIDAGQRGGAAVIAVASGAHTIDDLRKAGGMVALPSLQNTATLLAHIAALTKR
jgi:phosphoglycolate phosphatase